MSYGRRAKATSALSAPVPVAITMNCRPERVRYVIGTAAFSYGIFAAPDFLAGLLVERIEIAVSAADEHQAALGHHRAAAAIRRPETVRQRDAFQQWVSRESQRLPSPNGTFHAISPLFRSMAVNTAQGGDTSGRPPGRLTDSPPRANTFE